MKIVLFCVFTATSVLAHLDSGQIIYGEDNRLDIAEVQDYKIKEIAKSVAGRVSNTAFQIDDKEFNFGRTLLLSDNWGGAVCKDEKFANQPSISDCSGFLVGDDLLATAGHCIVDSMGSVENETTGNCSENSWVFDYVAHGDNVQMENLNIDKLYGCKKVIYAIVDDTADFALIQLDRKVVDRKPLKIRKQNKIEVGQDIFVLGYPSGLPLKYAGGAKVFENSLSDYFSTNLDTFGGNSGSPVFNAETYEVEGILVRGKTDYVDSEQNGQYCRRVNTCNTERGDCLVEDTQIDGEHVNRMDRLLSYL